MNLILLRNIKAILLVVYWDAGKLAIACLLCSAALLCWCPPLVRTEGCKASLRRQQASKKRILIFLTRLNQTSILAERAGTFYGQCSEICGVWHGFMPIAVEAVSVQDYLAWINSNS